MDYLQQIACTPSRILFCWKTTPHLQLLYLLSFSRSFGFSFLLQLKFPLCVSFAETSSCRRLHTCTKRKRSEAGFDGVGW